jgi:hypothetical protein
VPVASVAGFTVGEKIGIGYGATYPAVANDVEKYEVATVTESASRARKPIWRRTRKRATPTSK